MPNIISISTKELTANAANRKNKKNSPLIPISTKELTANAANRKNKRILPLIPISRKPAHHQCRKAKAKNSRAPHLYQQKASPPPTPQTERTKKIRPSSLSAESQLTTNATNRKNKKICPSSLSAVSRPTANAAKLKQKTGAPLFPIKNAAS